MKIEAAHSGRLFYCLTSIAFTKPAPSPNRAETTKATRPEPRARLRRIVYEALPLDAARLKEWKVWIVFWAAATSNGDLAQENARRYKQWQSLLSELIANIAGPQGVDERALALVSMVDGLGIRIALAPSAQNRQLANACIDRWIGNL